jgi:hypothetical protein
MTKAIPVCKQLRQYLRASCRRNVVSSAELTAEKLPEKKRAP